VNQFSRKILQKVHIIILLKCLANDLNDEILTIKKKKIKKGVFTVRIISKICLKIIIQYCKKKKNQS